MPNRKNYTNALIRVANNIRNDMAVRLCDNCLGGGGAGHYYEIEYVEQRLQLHHDLKGGHHYTAICLNYGYTSALFWKSFITVRRHLFNSFSMFIFRRKRTELNVIKSHTAAK